MTPDHILDLCKLYIHHGRQTSVAAQVLYTLVEHYDAVFALPDDKRSWEYFHENFLMPEMAKLNVKPPALSSFRSVVGMPMCRPVKGNEIIFIPGTYITFAKPELETTFADSTFREKLREPALNKLRNIRETKATIAERLSKAACETGANYNDGGVDHMVPICAWDNTTIPGDTKDKACSVGELLSIVQRTKPNHPAFCVLAKEFPELYEGTTLTVKVTQYLDPAAYETHYAKQAFVETDPFTGAEIKREWFVFAWRRKEGV